MTFKKSILSLTYLSTLALSACGGYGLYKNPKMEKAEYWQRQNASSAIYMQGPKAQQLLHKNIANCTVEIRELQNLGEIRRAIPANYNNGNSLNGERTASQKTLDGWDTPERDGYLRSEHLDYTDFESCMYAKGWERAEYLPYTDADKARTDYKKRYGRVFNSRKHDRENVTSLNTRSQNPAPYENLND
jgi:hypothetical protein